ncbi:MAG: hypothetical protein ACI4BA_03980 [Prevotella sp.]
MNRLFNMLFVSAVLMLTACEKSEERFSTAYPCHLVFDTSLYRIDCKLTQCLSNPGMFVMVKKTVNAENGSYALELTGNDGEPAQKVYATTEKQKAGIGTLGASDCIIVGCTNFNGLAAFDRQCPLCMEEKSGTAYPLEFQDKGQEVKCNSCGATYALQYDGSGDNGRSLYRYKVRWDGVVLSISNQ